MLHSKEEMDKVWSVHAKRVIESRQAAERKELAKQRKHEKQVRDREKAKLRKDRKKRGSSGCDYDAIYIWLAVGVFYNGEQVYKVGLTSHRLGDQRIKHVAKGASVEFQLVSLRKTTCNAAHVESKLLALGMNPKLQGFDGCTEFRAMTPAALATALDVIALHS